MTWPSSTSATMAPTPWDWRRTKALVPSSDGEEDATEGGCLLGYHRHLREAYSRAHARFFWVTKVPRVLPRHCRTRSEVQ